jgi:heme/copper-type cytochrome/quinol oxidase subunit 2
MSNPNPPAGMYPDPEDPTGARQRYWDGTQWTNAPPAPSAMPAYSQANPQPADYLVWSILNLVCLCLPIGILALVFSIQTRNATDPVQAQALSQKAKTANIAATILGAIVIIVWVALRATTHMATS